MTFDNNTRKRKLSISRIVLSNLQEISEAFKISKSTFIRIAIYHGIEKIHEGYRPYRIHRNDIKQKYNITLPEETWNLFDDAMFLIQEELENTNNDNTSYRADKMKHKSEHKFTHGEMIELFLRIEIDKYNELVKEIENNDHMDNKMLLEEQERVYFTADIPMVLYDKYCDIKELTGLQDTRIGRYLIIKSLMNEYLQKDYQSIYTDADLLRYIEALGLDKVKALTLISNLIQADKIVLKRH